MEKTKILFVSQEITPYLPESEMSSIGRVLPQGIQEKGKEIRTFMPRYGSVNERRNQLHEVIRLSGMNLIINDTDHPLIIKVGSIQTARMQVYFIDNEDYFERKFVLHDENDKEFKDNDERLVFFNRGVIETVKKLRWTPDIVHCHGWFTGLTPFYLKKAFFNDPLFNEAKIIYSIYDNDFKDTLNSSFKTKLKMSGIKDEELDIFDNPTFFNLSKVAIDNSDALMYGSPQINPEVEEYIKTLDKPVLPFYPQDQIVDKYSDFYDKLLAGDYDK